MVRRPLHLVDDLSSRSAYHLLQDPCQRGDLLAAGGELLPVSVALELGLKGVPQAQLQGDGVEGRRRAGERFEAHVR
jgi:hypothetical protein